MLTQVLESTDKNVWKYIFTFQDAIAEAVLYKYETFEKRTVICCSVQCGCPVGCSFCGTGAKFKRNLLADEIVEQVCLVLKDKAIENINSISEKFQIMFMSMGEPMLNWREVRKAIVRLNNLYPNADLLISTVGINDADVLEDILYVSKSISKVGLQFSVHASDDALRAYLIPYPDKLNLEQLRDFGAIWWKETGRKPYINYCVTPDNGSYRDAVALQQLFSPAIFSLTCSVLCSSEKDTMKDVSNKYHAHINTFMHTFLRKGYSCRKFDPAGQDDIGGGCGQLWFVQEFLKK